MSNEKHDGAWKGRRVLFIGDSLTEAHIYPEVVKEILGIETFYHCKGGASLQSMIDGDKGIEGSYDADTDAAGVLRPLSTDEVKDMDLVVLFGGYNSRWIDIGQVGDLYRPDGAGQNTVAGLMQYAINRIYEVLRAAENMTCRLLIVTVDCSGKYPYADADAYQETAPNTGRTLEAMAAMQRAVAKRNAIPCCDLFRTSGINPHTWAYFSASPDAENPHYTPYRLDEAGQPVSNEKIRYVKGESYYQRRGDRIMLERYDGRSPFPYIGDQLHKSPAGYRRIGEVIAGAIIAAYGN
ncbi:MAG: hypothetical protein IJW44_01050 [Clostridia bacterium]|nr:hypothetical protein [Clostridia bacterium]